jgi:hypothetical protein
MSNVRDWEFAAFTPPPATKILPATVTGNTPCRATGIGVPARHAFRRGS